MGLASHSTYFEQHCHGQQSSTELAEPLKQVSAVHTALGQQGSSQCSQLCNALIYLLGQRDQMCSRQNHPSTRLSRITSAQPLWRELRPERFISPMKLLLLLYLSSSRLRQRRDHHGARSSRQPWISQSFGEVSTGVFAGWS